MTVHTAKSQISLGIHSVWSESVLCAQRVAKDPWFHLADSEDFDQTGRMPRLIWVFAGHTRQFVGFVMRQFIYILPCPTTLKTSFLMTWLKYKLCQENSDLSIIQFMTIPMYMYLGSRIGSAKIIWLCLKALCKKGVQPSLSQRRAPFSYHKICCSHPKTLPQSNAPKRCRHTCKQCRP